MDKDDSLAEKESVVKEISPMRSAVVSALYVPINNQSYVWYVRIFGSNGCAFKLFSCASIPICKIMAVCLSYYELEFNVLFACFSN